MRGVDADLVAALATETPVANALRGIVDGKPFVQLVAAAAFTFAIALPASACDGCSCRGGPGYRLPNGKCSSWKQHASYCNGACYPPGTNNEAAALGLRVPISPDVSKQITPLPK